MNYLLGLIFIGFSIIAQADDALSLNVNAKQSRFMVTLDANPTTGYQWSVVAFDKKLLTLSKSNYVKSDSKLIGSGGQMLFTFKQNTNKTSPATTNIVFKYSRPWEHEGGTLKTVTVHFVK